MSATQPAGSAVLLVNLGTPDAPTRRAVRRYLAEFLHDRRVVDLSPWLWWPVLHGAILPLRAPRVAAKYAKIWMAAPRARPPAARSPTAARGRRTAAAPRRRCCARCRPGTSRRVIMPSAC